MDGSDMVRVVEFLTGRGLAVTPGDVERREHRWLVRHGDVLVWLAADQRGAQALARERAMFAAVRGRLGIAVPEVIEILPDGRGDIRRPVPGLVDHAVVRRAVLGDRDLARRIGVHLGRVLAALHEIPPPTEALTTVAWPEPTLWIRERLPEVLADSVADTSLLARIEATLDRFDASVTPERDRVLVHTDVGYHNLVFDPSSLDLVGIFDFVEAARGDRHWDLSDLIDEGALSAAAQTSYQEVAGVILDQARLSLCNAVRAACFLANRRGVDASVVWCGRTLAQDLAWCRSALDRLHGDA